MQIRPASPHAHAEQIWAILEPTIRAGETYPLPRDMTRKDALEYWFTPQHEVLVAEENAQILGTYFLQANQLGGGAHVANSASITAPWATGQGVAHPMCAHSLDRPPKPAFKAMQF